MSDYWWHAAVTAACTIRNCLVNEASLLVGHQAPWTQITNYSTEYDHLTSAWFGAIGTVPRVGNKRLLGTKNELCVVICPIFNNTKSHLVILDGHKTPSIRGGFLLIQEEVQRLSIQQIKALETKFDSNGYLLDFKSHVDEDFTLFDKVREHKHEELSTLSDSQADGSTLHMTSKINPDSHSNTFDQSQVSQIVNNADTISSSSGNISTSNTASIEPTYLNTDLASNSTDNTDIQSDVFSSVSQ